MTAVAIKTTDQLPGPAELEREILARIDRAVQICETELRYKLRWDDQRARIVVGAARRARAPRPDRERPALPPHQTRPRTTP